LERKLHIPFYFIFNTKTKVDCAVKKLFVVNPLFSMVYWPFKEIYSAINGKGHRIVDKGIMQ